MCQKVHMATHPTGLWSMSFGFDHLTSHILIITLPDVNAELLWSIRIKQCHKRDLNLGWLRTAGVKWLNLSSWSNVFLNCFISSFLSSDVAFSSVMNAFVLLYLEPSALLKAFSVFFLENVSLYLFIFKSLFFFKKKRKKPIRTFETCNTFRNKVGMGIILYDEIWHHHPSGYIQFASLNQIQKLVAVPVMTTRSRLQIWIEDLTVHRHSYLTWDWSDSGPLWLAHRSKAYRALVFARVTMSSISRHIISDSTCFIGCFDSNSLKDVWTDLIGMNIRRY